MSWREVAGVSHLVAGALLAGGVLTMAWLGWRRRPGDAHGRDQWSEIHGAWCRVALVLLAVAVASGLLVLHSTLIAYSLLTSTPYGKLLGAKVILTVLLGSGLLFGMRHDAMSLIGSSFMRLFGGLVAVAIIVISFMMRYV
jgi:putative copper export protein